MTATIDPRRRPIFGVAPIGKYFGLSEGIAYREILKGNIRAWRVGPQRKRSPWISTPEALDQSPLVTGRPIEAA